MRFERIMDKMGKVSSMVLKTYVQNGSEFHIRLMARNAVGLAIDWAVREGWNPGLEDLDAFYATDPNGWFATETEDGQVIACTSAIAYDDTFGFMGLYIVDPAYRKAGHGMILANFSRDYLGKRNIGIDGVVEMQSHYKQWGFQMAYNNIRYKSIGGGKVLDSTQPYDTSLFGAVSAYDQRFFPTPRRTFLKAWLSQPKACCRVVLDGEKIVGGYGMIRPCHAGFKIGPLFADNAEIAEVLFCTLSAQVPGEPVFLDVPEPNKAAMSLAKRYSMEKVFETARMYTQEMPDIELQGVFGVTSFELG